jgi:hypothetical protein
MGQGFEPLSDYSSMVLDYQEQEHKPVKMCTKSWFFKATT